MSCYNAYMKECPFCNLGDRIIKQNKAAILFLSNPRKVPGHFLVVPKRHIEIPWEINKSELQDIFDLIFFTQKKVLSKLSEGVDVRQNYRPFLKQGGTKVDHVHFHVIPRDNEDNLYEKVERRETPIFENLSSKEHDDMKSILD